MCAETGTTAHRAQTISCHHYPSSPLLSPVQPPPRAAEGGGKEGGVPLSPSSFLSSTSCFPAFFNPSSVVSQSPSLVTSENKTRRLPVCPPVCLYLKGEMFLSHAAIFFIQSDKNRGWWLWIRHAHDSFALLQRKDVIYFFFLTYFSFLLLSSASRRPPWSLSVFWSDFMLYTFNFWLF